MHGRISLNFMCSFSRQILIIVLVFAVLVSGCREKPATVYCIGIVCGGEHFLPIVNGFKNEMAEMGYVEGRTIEYDMRTAYDDPHAARRAAERFMKSGVDLILTVPTKPTIKVQAAIKDSGIPLVFAYAGIEGTGLVESVSRPGKNTTGLRFPGPEQVSKRLELLLEFVPGIKRVWIGYDKHYPNAVPTLNTLRPLALERGVTLVEVAAESISQIIADLKRRAAATDPGVDAIILMPDDFNHSPPGWAAIRNFAVAQKIPLGGSFLNNVEEGALFCNANDLFGVGELTAPLVDKILKGTPAGVIPVVTPPQVLIINYRVAEKLGMRIPAGLLNMASQIIR